MHLFWLRYSLASDKSNAILYADDTTLVGPLCDFKYDRKSNDYNNISNHINAELNEICKWLSSNKLFIKWALYRIWYGVNRLGDSGVKVV